MPCVFFKERKPLARSLVVALLLVVAESVAWANSLSYCSQQVETSALDQDRLLQVAAIVKSELDQSGQQVALIARSGLALHRLNQRYSHAGVTLRASRNTPWSVRQLYFACDEQRPRIFDQGMTGFVMGANDPAEAYLSIVFLPPDAGQALEAVALDDHIALDLLGGRYSANAHAFSLRYQNCNQWLAELLASAWGTIPPGPDARSAAQHWLQQEGYQPSVLQIGWQPFMWLAAALPWLHSDDHPDADLAQAQVQVSMPQSIESFVQKRLIGATRLELCYSQHHVVIRRGWEPLGPGCIPERDDQVTLL